MIPTSETHYQRGDYQTRTRLSGSKELQSDTSMYGEENSIQAQPSLLFIFGNYLFVVHINSYL
jgi:hypothetical protein